MTIHPNEHLWTIAGFTPSRFTRFFLVGIMFVLGGWPILALMAIGLDDPRADPARSNVCLLLGIFLLIAILCALGFRTEKVIDLRNRALVASWGFFGVWRSRRWPLEVFRQVLIERRYVRRHNTLRVRFALHLLGQDSAGHAIDLCFGSYRRWEVAGNLAHQVATVVGCTVEYVDHATPSHRIAILLRPIRKLLKLAFLPMRITGWPLASLLKGRSGHGDAVER